MFVASFFLPATNALETPGSAPGTPMTGWETMCSVQVVVHPFVLLAEPRVFLFLLFPILNLAALVSPRLVPAAEDIWPAAALAFLLVGSLAWFLPTTMLGERFVGYWLWHSSFFVMAVGWSLFGIYE